MKKKIVLVLCMIMLLIMSMALAVACDNKDKTPPDNNGITNDGDNGDNGGNGGGDIGDSGDNGGNLPSDGIVDISQYLTFELNEDGNSYAVTGLKEEIKDKICTTFEEDDMSKYVDKVKIIIPSQYEGKQVTAIGDDAFACCIGLVNITIPETVTQIGDRVFAYCIRLKGIDLPTNTSTLGEYAFVGCTNLKSIVIPNQVKEIKSWTFGYCTGLEQVSIPDTLTSISEEAFLFCVGLTNIVIPSSVTKIDIGAFEQCVRLVEIYNKSSLDIVVGSEDNGKIALFAKNVYAEEDGSKLSTYANDYLIYTDGEEKALVKYMGEDKNLTLPNDITAINSRAFVDFSAPGLEWLHIEDTYILESIIIPDSVTSIGSWAFFGCGNLSNVDIGDSVTSIGEKAFANCSNLISITIPDSVTSIEASTFEDCERLQSAIIGSGVRNIGEHTFFGCKSLASIIIPDNVTSIGNNAFGNCYSLTSATIGRSVTNVENNAFGSCYSLIEVYNRSSLTIIAGCPPIFGEKIGYYAKNVYTKEGGSKLSTDEDGYIIYTDGEDKILVKYTGADTDLTLPSDITEINNHTFWECDNLTSITIPDSVKIIGNNAFYSCSSLKSVTIGNGLTSISQGAFAECNSLTEITIPFVGGNKDEINKAFLGYIFGASSPSENSSYVPNSLKSVTVVGDTIASNAFSCCYYVTDVTLDGVKSIGQFAFEGCLRLTNITIPNTVASIGDFAFLYCNGLTSINIPDSVTNIGLGTFAGGNIIEITVDEENTKYHSDGNCIIESATKTLVSGCSTSIIPTDGSVTSIGYAAFVYCDFSNIIIPNNVTSIGMGAFEYCHNLRSISIPASVTSIGLGAFSCGNITELTVDEENTKYHSDGNCIIETATKTVVVGCSTSIIPTDGSVTSIGDGAFAGSGIKDVFLPDSVTSIGNNAFMDCYELISITISENIDYIGAEAFFCCYNLIEICNKSSIDIIAGEYNTTFLGYYAKNVYTEEGGSKLSTDEDCYIIYTDGEDKILVKYTGTDTDLTLPNGITEINQGAFCQQIFYDCNKITSIFIPDGVTKIGKSAFFWCSNLTSITIPNSVTSIENAAFSGCNSLTDIIFKGTKEQWRTIEKDNYWHETFDCITIVHCTDGDITEE